MSIYCSVRWFFFFWFNKPPHSTLCREAMASVRRIGDMIEDAPDASEFLPLFSFFSPQSTSEPRDGKKEEGEHKNGMTTTGNLLVKRHFLAIKLGLDKLQ